MIGKSIWTLLYDSVTIKIVFNSLNSDKPKPGIGFFYLVYDEELHVYQYRINTITKTTNENKCDVKQIYQGNVIDVTDKDEMVKLIKQHYNKIPHFNSSKQDKMLLNIESSFPIFRVRYEDKFPLEGSLLSIAKRKIMNYIFQTIKIQELKS